MSVRVSHSMQTLSRAVEVGDIVRELRKFGLTAGDIGKAAGVTERSVRNWKAAAAPRRRQEARVFTLRDIVIQLQQTLSPRGVGQWLRAPNRLLQGRRPLDALAEGEAAAVRTAAASYVEGTYV